MQYHNLVSSSYTVYCVLFIETKMNLDDFICMDARVGYGEVYNLSDFVQHFGVK